LAKHPSTTQTNLYKALDTVIQQQLSQDSQMMMEIQLYNPYVKSIIASLADSFVELQHAIQNNCPEGVKHFIEKAKSIKV
jgi:prephenate dehydrogenase